MMTPHLFVDEVYRVRLPTTQWRLQLSKTHDSWLSEIHHALNK